MACVDAISCLDFGGSIGCSPIFSKVDDTGNTKLVIFPNVIDATMKEGTRPNLNNLKSARPGASKDQLY